MSWFTSGIKFKKTAGRPTPKNQGTAQASRPTVITTRPSGLLWGTGGTATVPGPAKIGPAAPAKRATVIPTVAEPKFARSEHPASQKSVRTADSRKISEFPSAVPAAGAQPYSKDFVDTPKVPPVAVIREKSAAPNLLKFFGLQQQPFDVTPDPAFLYYSPSHREALASLSQGIEHFRGFMMLVAPPGMGKTMLLNKLLEELGDKARVVFLFQTQCDSSELLTFILNELEVDHTGMDVVTMHRVLNQVLLEEMLRGQRFVLIVDEAQNLQEPVLETIRLLSDFETTHSKLIQIVLAGQPRLAHTLLKPGLAQLRQRVSILSQLRPLSARETAEYVEHRLRAAGSNGKHLFTRDALELIAALSKGVPRTINNLCFNALLMAFQRGEEVVDAGMVRRISEKLDLQAVARHPHSDKNAVSASPLPNEISTAPLSSKQF